MVPTVDARMQARSHAIEELNSAIPAPGRPSRASAGTAQSSRKTSLIGDVLSPILCSGCPRVRPGVERTTRNAHRPANPLLGVVANTTTTSATGAFVTNVLDPLST